MKNIFKISTLLFAIIMLWSCTNDKDPVVSSNGFELRKDAAVVSPSVLLDENSASIFSRFEWDRANNGVATASSYVLVISDHDADPNFTNAVESTLGLNLALDAREANITQGDFNTLLNQLPTFNCNEMNIDVRVKSKLGVSTNTLYQYSNPITIAVKGYPKTLPILAFVKDGSSASNSAKLASVDYKTFTNYEGYMYLEAGDYKFYKPDACGEFSNPSIYGVSGNTLVQAGPTSYTVTTTGHYLVNADLVANTFSLTAYSFGIFGAATRPFGFANITPMVYDVTSKTWKLTIELINGKKFGFKTGNGSTPVSIFKGTGTGSTETSPITVVPTPYVAADYGDGTIKAPGDYVDLNTKTKYDVIVDISNPRNYTYQLVLNPN